MLPMTRIAIVEHVLVSSAQCVCVLPLVLDLLPQNHLLFSLSFLLPLFALPEKAQAQYIIDTTTSRSETCDLNTPLCVRPLGAACVCVFALLCLCSCATSWPGEGRDFVCFGKICLRFRVSQIFCAAALAECESFPLSRGRISSPGLGLPPSLPRLCSNWSPPPTTKTSRIAYVT